MARNCSFNPFGFDPYVALRDACAYMLQKLPHKGDVKAVIEKDKQL